MTLHNITSHYVAFPTQRDNYPVTRWGELHCTELHCIVPRSITLNYITSDLTAPNGVMPHHGAYINIYDPTTLAFSSLRCEDSFCVVETRVAESWDRI